MRNFRLVPDDPQSTDRYRTGVIDIGSNSVRLVVYDGIRRVPTLIFNEKVSCRLGRNIAETGRLDPHGALEAHAAIRRFMTLTGEMEIDELHLVATAAIRDAEDGADFVARIESENKTRVTVLSGMAEARYSALGVVAGIPDAHGIVGDLGGGSLELVTVADGRPGSSATLPLGPLRFKELFEKQRSKFSELASQYLNQHAWLRESTGQPFYAVGGAWRALARMHIQYENYPLAIIHGYKIGVTPAKKFLKMISNTEKDALLDNYDLAKDRLETAAYAAFLLDHILDLIQPSEIVVSGLGLREGFIFSGLPKSIRNHDPLIMICEDLARHTGRFPDHGTELQEWIEPLFSDLPASRKRIYFAACLLSDIGWRGHPSYRAQKVFEDVLYGQLIGLDHGERAFLALALYASYTKNMNQHTTETVARLLGDDEILQAMRLGRAIRLGQRVSGGTSGLLRRTELRIVGDALCLRVGGAHEYLISEVVENRLNSLAEIFGKAATIEIDEFDPDPQNLTLPFND